MWNEYNGMQIANKLQCDTKVDWCHETYLTLFSAVPTIAVVTTSVACHQMKMKLKQLLCQSFLG